MDNSTRLDRFKRDNNLEGVVRELADLLRCAQDAASEALDHPQMPVLLLVGVPRSGTTLLMQRLARTGAFGYPSNLVSRFYTAPYVGVRVQQMLIDYDIRYETSLADETVDYTSSLGKTSGATSPNEFWYFWRRFFPQERVEAGQGVRAADVDVARLLRDLASMEAGFGKPLAFKAMMMNYQIALLDAIVPNLLLVDVVRDPRFTMQSLLSARRKFFGTEGAWYSFKPPQVDELSGLDPVGQVAGQVGHMRQEIDRALGAVAPGRAVRVRYEDLCERPELVLGALADRYAAAGVELDLGPAGSEPTGSKDVVTSSDERWDAIESAWDAFQAGD